MTINSHPEVQRRILDWLPDYDVSELGEVRRITPAVTRGAVPYVVAGSTSNGYRRVKVMLPSERKACLLVHRLVCEAFYGPPPSGKHHAAHFDGERANNVVSNLRWTSPMGNVGHDRTRHGRQPAGERNGRAKLTAASVRLARAEFTGKHGDLARIARKFGVAETTMSQVIRGTHWKSV